MEEDIKILEELWLDVLLTNNFNKFICNNDKYRRAIENLIKGYRELKEGCKTCVIRDDLHEYVENSIPKSKIKEKIEEVEKYTYKGENAPQDFLQYRIKAKIQVLQELLGDE